MKLLNAQGKDVNASVKLSGYQMDISSDISKNRMKILSAIAFASKEGADFLVTPEGSLSGYTSDFRQEDLIPALEEITREAAKLKIGLMLGTCYREKISGREYCYNQVRVYSPEGNFLGAYSKILRCSRLDLPGSGEMVDYVEGELRTFDWKGIRFGILICNDLWATPGYTTMPNPYLPWKLRQMGADLIVHCINSGTDQRYRSFHESSAELWAMSLGIPVFEVNAASGNDKINAQSGLISASGSRIVNVSDSGSQFFSGTVSKGNGVTSGK